MTEHVKLSRMNPSDKLDKETSAMRETMRKFRLIAFFLPQFHPIPENDVWWGKGFTEWTNVTKASPFFSGHYQPHLPADLGYYDLRLKETRHDQIALARKYGIDGFCYHYYWFSGKRLLHRPLDEMLADYDNDMPFCLCWANENWTRRWDAAENEILIAQRYLPDDDLNFIKDLTPFLKDPRYIKINGALLLIVYRPQHLRDPKATAQIWRDYCHSNGIGEIHLCAALTHGNTDYAQFGFDSGVEFPPHNLNINTVNEKLVFHQPFKGRTFFFHEVADTYLNRTYPSNNVFRCVFPSWDNTARTKHHALIVLNGTPENYEYWLAKAIQRTTEDFPDQERIVFINAWNEWAEGCHLEPDHKDGLKFLDATLRAKASQSNLTGFSDITVPQDVSYSRKVFLVDFGKLVMYQLYYYKQRLHNLLSRMPKVKRVIQLLLSVIRKCLK
jgi:lipopolysaccharide biosynthesis protein